MTTQPDKSHSVIDAKNITHSFKIRENIYIYRVNKKTGISGIFADLCILGRKIVLNKRKIQSSNFSDFLPKIMRVKPPPFM